MINETVEICRERKEVASELAKLAVKVIIREIAIKKLLTKESVRVATFIGLMVSGRVEFRKVHLDITMLIVDGVQCGLEYFEYTEVGKNVGSYGNIAVGATVGGNYAGVIGIAIGAILGFGIWVVGEAVGRGVNEILL